MERRDATGCHDLARFQVFASLVGTVASERVAVISALLFGIPRYAGTPGQVIGGARGDLPQLLPGHVRPRDRASWADNVIVFATVLD
jgi:hypothetical protein